MLFNLLQTVYWLALSSWFGAVLFVAVAAPVIFRTVRKANPILPNVLAVNLEQQHGSLLAGTIVGEILNVLGKLQIICAIAILLAIMVQWVILDRSNPTQLFALIVRSSLGVAAAGFLYYDRRILWPKIWSARAEYLDHADEPDIANPAKERFDRLHKESVTVLCFILCLLTGLILFSTFITPFAVSLNFRG
jgi:hypothetical protein